MIIYTRGDRIPPEKRDSRFVYKGKLSAIALKKYWRLQTDGTPDPDCKPFWRRFEIELLHRAYPELGPYQINADPPGRKRTIKDRAEYDRQKQRDRYAKKKNSI